jgi:TonB family protein
MVAHVAFAALFLLALEYGAQPFTSSGLVQAPINQQIVWLAEPGPGGGGGGGGNKSPEPARKAEFPGKDKITVPVVELPKLENPVIPQDKEPQQLFDIPATTLAADLNAIVPGVIDGSVLSPSQGSGSGGGGGTGTGSGIGSGTGSGLGPGYGGGTGGGPRRPGNGVAAPRLLKKVDPQYTADAMRAKVQGTVEIECIVQPNGICSNIDVVRSLDRSFGLDGEAVKAVQQWRFVPGHFQGQEVPVIVTIELTFTLR